MRKLVTILSAAAILFAAGVSAPTRSAAADSGSGDSPPVSAKPGIRTIQAGEPITLQKGERARVMLPQKAPFVAQPYVKSDEAKLAEWLTGRKGLTFAAVQAFIAAEKLTIPADFLTDIRNNLEGSGVTPGPSSNPGINQLLKIRSYYTYEWIYVDNLGESHRSLGIVGGASNSGTHMIDVPVSITKTIASSATVTTGIGAGGVSAQVGFNVTFSEAVTVGIVVQDVAPGEYVQIRGWKAGDLVLYQYNRYKWVVYWDTVGRQYVTEMEGLTEYAGNAFHAQWMELEALN